MRGNIAVYMIMLIAVIWGLFILFPTPSMDLNEDNAGFYLNLMEKLNITNTTINVSGANGSLESARLVSNETGEWIAGDVILNDGNIVMNGSSQEVDGVDISVLESDFSSHEGDTDNPHEVTKTQVGLGDVENTALSTWGGSEYITNTGVLSDLNVTQTSTSGYGLYVTRNLAAASTDSPLGYFYNENSGDDQPCVKFDNKGTSHGFLLTNDNWAVGTSPAMTIRRTTDEYERIHFLIQNLTGYGATSAWFYRNLTAADTSGPVVLIEQDNSGDDQNVLNIKNDGTGYGCYIDQNGANYGLVVNSADGPYIAVHISGMSGQAILLGNPNLNPGLGTGNNIFYSTVNDAYDVVQITKGAGTGIPLRIGNDGTGTGLFIDQNGDSIAINIDSESTTTNAITIAAKYGLQVTQDISGGRGGYFYRNINEAGSNGLLVVTNDHTADTYPSIAITHDGDTGSSSGSLYISTTNSNNDNAIYHSSGAKLTQTGTWTNAPSYSWLKTTVQSSKDMNVLDIFRNLDLQSWIWKDVYRCSVQDNHDMDGDVTKDTVCLNNYITDKDIHYGAYLDDMGESFGINTDGVNTQDWIGINQIAIQQLIEKIDSLENRLNTICKNNPDLRECYGG
jgi:hypothetical protein